MNPFSSILSALFVAAPEDDMLSFLYRFSMKKARAVARALRIVLLVA
jgi:hypothetical protein